MSLKVDNDYLIEAWYCDIAEMYPDMAETMKNALQNCSENDLEITLQHRNLFSLAYKNWISARRSSWRILYIEKQKLDDTQTDKLIILDKLMRRVKNELLEKCNEVIDIIDKYALPKVSETNVEYNVFFLKMKGDYYRYKAEVLSGEEEKEASNIALQNYLQAKDHADVLMSTNPIRLGFYLNFSVFYYEILNDTEMACKIAKSAFDSAIADLDTLSEDFYKDSTLIMQLLRDNLTLWTSKNDISSNKKNDNDE